MPDRLFVGAPAVYRRLVAMERRPVNFDPTELDRDPLPRDWRVDHLTQELPGEAPGAPVAGGSWETARRLMRGYDFADPSIVRAFYDPTVPLASRTMLLRLQALGFVHVFVGVRVAAVVDDERVEHGRRVRIWGWSYQTLEGHIEEGRMSWQVWKWLDSGTVEFHVDSTWRRAHIRNPLVAVGFRVVGSHERHLFLDTTLQRMLAMTSAILDHGNNPAAVLEVSRNTTARRWRGGGQSHVRLRRLLERGTNPVSW